jgi:hypothetical protein
MPGVEIPEPVLPERAKPVTPYGQPPGCIVLRKEKRQIRHTAGGGGSNPTPVRMAWTLSLGNLKPGEASLSSEAAAARISRNGSARANSWASSNYSDPDIKRRHRSPNRESPERRNDPRSELELRARGYCCGYRFKKIKYLRLMMYWPKTDRYSSGDLRHLKILRA